MDFLGCIVFLASGAEAYYGPGYENFEGSYANSVFLGTPQLPAVAG